MRLWLLGLLLMPVAHSSDINVEVAKEKNNTYVFHMQFVAKASAEKVYAIITDYNHLARLNPLIKQTRVLPQDNEGVTRVELLTEGCMFFFCKKIIRVEDAIEHDDLSIETTFVPELSDFKSGHTRWTFTAVGQNTLVNYHASMIPDFWLPPFVGPYMLKKQLRAQLHYTANKINSLLLSNASE